MLPRATGKRTTNKSPATDPQGMFSGMVAFLTETGVQSRRLQIWRQKLMQMGGSVEDTFSKKVTRVFAMNLDSLLQEIDRGRLARSKAKILLYQWIEDSLREGKRAPEESYILSLESGGGDKASNASEATFHKYENESHPDAGEPVASKKSRISREDPRHTSPQDAIKSQAYESSNTTSGSDNSLHSPGSEVTSSMTFEGQTKNAAASDSKLLYSPPDLNRNITEIFRKLIDIYRAMGDDRRSFSYYKAIPVIEKLPFKIESVDQVKHLPGIGKSLQEHVSKEEVPLLNRSLRLMLSLILRLTQKIQEIVTTGKLSKLEHFEKDEKVRTISLFGEIWGVGPATALKLYDKGYRTLDDLNNEESLTNSQRLGLKYFNDIRTRIPRQEVQEMERLLQTVGEDILPGVVIVCGGSYRRGKASCGDMDIVITHPDGKSHKGFLPKFVKRLKDMNFLREDLIFSIHSEEGTDSGVDTYFGLCTFPGRELRHRIDLKVYPRDIYAFGLIAWTGNDVLNRRLRLLAESKGFRLDDTGLFPATQASSSKRGMKGSASLKFNTEKEVFDFLGFPWLEPNERNL